jgi:hypothetical protein
MKIYETEINGETVEYVEIELSEGHFTSMMKSTYDAMQAEQSTPMVTDETPTL